jgi:hypothetical protein
MVKFSLRQILIWMAIAGCLLASIHAVIWPRTGLLDALVYVVLDRTSQLRIETDSMGDSVLGAPNSKGLLDAAALAILAYGLTWWLHRQSLGRFWTASSKLWIASLAAYGVADILLFVIIVRRDELGWDALAWLLVCVLAAAVGTTMAFCWLLQSLFQRLRGTESFQYSFTGWMARALALLVLALPCVLVSVGFLFFAGPIDPTH